MTSTTVTWEPWEPVPASDGQAAQYADQAPLEATPGLPVRARGA